MHFIADYLSFQLQENMPSGYYLIKGTNNVEDIYDWEEETEEIENKNIDPIESGYDVPIL